MRAYACSTGTGASSAGEAASAIANNRKASVQKMMAPGFQAGSYYECESYVNFSLFVAYCSNVRLVSDANFL
jgi:hypothetical protein